MKKLASAWLLALGVAVALVACGSTDAGPPGNQDPRRDAGVGGGGGADAGSPDAGGPVCMPIAASRETVRVNDARGALEGTLDVPKGCGPLPVVLILSGSGVTDRDGDVPGDPAKPDIYRILAEQILASGVAVLRYDDAGAGKSVNAFPAKIEDFRFEMEIGDAALFVAELRADKRFGALIAAGHSQGSLTAIMVAEQQPIDGYISLEGAGRPIGDVYREQVAPHLSPSDLMKLDAALAKLSMGELAGPLAPPLDAILPLDYQPYLISWMKVNPKTEIAKLKAPALLLQGKMDLQVQVLDANLLQQGKPDAKLVLVDDMNHMLRKVKAKTSAAQQASYTQPLPLHPLAVAAITSFLSGFKKP